MGFNSGVKGLTLADMKLKRGVTLLARSVFLPMVFKSMAVFKENITGNARIT